MNVAQIRVRDVGMPGPDGTAATLPAPLTIVLVSVTPHAGAIGSADRREHPLAMEVERGVAFDEVRINQIRLNPKLFQRFEGSLLRLLRSRWAQSLPLATTGNNACVTIRANVP